MALGIKVPPSNTLLIWVLAGCVIVLGIVALFVSGGDPRESSERYPQQITLEAMVVPSATSEQGVVEAPSGVGDLVVYLDVSHPMGGFLPPPSVPSPAPGLATVAQLLPGYLVRDYAGPTRWKTVANEVRSLTGTPDFDRSLFVGSETFLEPAVEEILRGLESGRIAAAMLLTDLVATSGPESAMAVARPLAPWLQSPAVQAGIFDAGILGVRTTFWGVKSSSCPAKGDVGCWYSEQANRYLPMSETVERPFYVLILGRTDGDPELVNSLGQKLRDELKDLDVETQWERFTERKGRRAARLECALSKHSESSDPAEKQYALVRDGDGTWSCQQDHPVELACDLYPNDSSTRLPLQGGEATWSWVETWVDAGSLHAVVDCSRLKRDSPEENLGFEHLFAEPSPAPELDWLSWTAYSDQRVEDLTGTLQLGLFLEKLRVRPERYQVELAEPVLKVVSDDK